MSKTYLQRCIKNGRTVRWPDRAMPIPVYIAPFRWYEKSKQREAYAYHQMVLDAMREWSELSDGLVRFRVVNHIQQSQIDLKWRRVDRKSLGHCEYNINAQGVLYSAEISIGISDGLLHAQYNDTGEVKHTILHEFGHALGLLDHSEQAGDIMYVPHQFGITQLSQRDGETLRRLYQLPLGFDYKAVGFQLQLPAPFSFDDAADAWLQEGDTSEPDSFAGFGNTFRASLQHAQAANVSQDEALERERQILSEMGKFYLSTQNIRLNPELKPLPKPPRHPGPPLR